MSSSSYYSLFLVVVFFSFFRVVLSFQIHCTHSFRVSNSVADRRSQSLKMYWNRESSTRNQFDDTTAPIVQTARIISVSDIHDPANDVLHRLVKEDSNNNKDNPIQLVAIGGNGGIQDFDIQELKQIQPNVIFMSHPTKGREILAEFLQNLPSIEWIHFRSAGIDWYLSPLLLSHLQSTHHHAVQMTNAKGIFSSTLAEYTMFAISYFAKDLPRLMKQKQDKVWYKYPILEVRRATLGIIGLGDIGKATAHLAKAYGMKIIALQRKKKLEDDEEESTTWVDQMYYMEQGKDNSLYPLLEQSDYILISTPLTDETRGMMDAQAFSHVKPGSVLINVGRGPIIDEPVMVNELKPGGRLKGAALDVFTVEPLPLTSELWTLPNTLISPHNMDKTEMFMHESTDFFLNENVQRFIRNIPLLNPVNPLSGY